VKDHTGGSQHPGEDTHGEGDGIDKPVDKGVKPDSQHGHETDIIVCIRSLITHKRIDESIKEMQSEIPTQKIERSI